MGIILVDCITIVWVVEAGGRCVEEGSSSNNTRTRQWLGQLLWPGSNGGLEEINSFEGMVPWLWLGS